VKKIIIILLPFALILCVAGALYVMNSFCFHLILGFGDYLIIASVITFISLMLNIYSTFLHYNMKDLV